MGYRIILPSGKALFETDNALTAGRFLIRSRTKVAGTTIKCKGNMEERLLSEVIDNCKGLFFGFCKSEGLDLPDKDSAAELVRTAIA